MTEKYAIGTLVEDKNGNVGIVCIKWSDDTLQHNIDDISHKKIHKKGHFSSLNGIVWEEIEI